MLDLVYIKDRHFLSILHDVVYILVSFQNNNITFCDSCPVVKSLYLFCTEPPYCHTIFFLSIIYVVNIRHISTIHTTFFLNKST